MAAGVRTPHQNRSWPSTNRTSARQAGHLGTMALAERVRLGREQDEVGMAGRDLVELHGRVAVRRIGEHAGEAEAGEHRGAVGVPLIVIHGRRQIGTNAVRGAAAAGAVGAGVQAWKASRSPAGRSTPTAAASASRHGSTSATASTCGHVQPQPGGRERVGVLGAGSPRRSRRPGPARARRSRRVGVLRAAHRRQVRVLAEAGAPRRARPPRPAATP